MNRIVKYIRKQIVVFYIRVKYKRKLFTMLTESEFEIGDVLTFNMGEKGIVVKNSKRDKSRLNYVGILHLNASTEKFKKWICI